MQFIMVESEKKKKYCIQLFLKKPSLETMPGIS